jgi:hypothetical protein
MAPVGRGWVQRDHAEKPRVQYREAEKIPTPNRFGFQRHVRLQLWCQGFPTVDEPMEQKQNKARKLQEDHYS